MDEATRNKRPSLADVMRSSAEGAYKKHGVPYDPEQGSQGSTSAPPLQPMSEGAVDKLVDSETSLLSSAAEGGLGTTEPAPFDRAAREPGVAPGVYKPTASTDPYSYQVNEDGTVTILTGGIGKSGRDNTGMTLSSGTAFDAILGQIRAGALKNQSEAGPPSGTPSGPMVANR